jgi:predicted ArsR family transcriptional regulator
MEPFIDISSANRGRLAVLWYVHQNAGVTRTQIAQATGVSLQATKVHLAGLESAGAIRADLPVDERHGRTVHYTADQRVIARALDAMLHCWKAFDTPEQSP